MTNLDSAPKSGTVTVAPVQVVSLWAHPMVLISVFAAIIPIVVTALVQFQALPGLPTNVAAGIGAAVSILTAIAAILRNLGLLGLPAVTPTAAVKMEQQNGASQ